MLHMQPMHRQCILAVRQAVGQHDDYMQCVRVLSYVYLAVKPTLLVDSS